MYRFYRFLSFRIFYFFFFYLCYSLIVTWIVRHKNFSMCCHVIPDDCGPSIRVEPLANKSFCILYSVRSSCNSIPSYTATMYYKYRPVILPPTSYEGSTFVSLSKGISSIYLRPNACTFTVRYCWCVSCSPGDYKVKLPFRIFSFWEIH